MEQEPTGHDFDKHKEQTRRIWLVEEIGPNRYQAIKFNSSGITGIVHSSNNQRTAVEFRQPNPESSLKFILERPHDAFFEFIHPRSPLIKKAADITLIRTYPAPKEV